MRTGSATTKHPIASTLPYADAAALLVLLLLAVGLPLAIGVVADSIGIPRNDDWSYRRIALEFARSGRLALDGAAETMIVGQILFAQPFLWLSGLEPWGFTAAGVFVAIGAIVGAYFMARRLLPVREATIAAGLLAVFPGYLAYATSFMSDVPALAAQMLCLALGSVAIAGGPFRARWLVASLAVGCIGFSVRDFALAAPVAVVVAALCANPRSRTVWVSALAIAAWCVGLYVWRSSLTGQLGDARTYYSGAPERIGAAVSSVAFVVLPAAILGAARWRRHWLASDLRLGFYLGVALVVARFTMRIVVGERGFVTLGNLASPWGVPASAYIQGGRPLLFGEFGWNLIELIAFAATLFVIMVVTAITGQHLRRLHVTGQRAVRAMLTGLGTPTGVLLLFCLMVGGGLFLFGLRWSLFDRYLWPIVPPLAVMLLYVPRDLRVTASSLTSGPRLVATSQGLLLSVISVVLLFNSHAFDAGRWRAGQVLVQAGVPATQIDAGYEWVGYYSTTPANAAQPVDAPIWYRGWWPAFRPCGEVTAQPGIVPSSELVGTIEYRRYLVAGPAETLYLYRSTEAPCR